MKEGKKMVNNRKNKWRLIKNLEAYRKMLDHNLQRRADGYVEEIDNTLVKVVKESIDKFCSRRGIKRVKLSENTKQLMVKRREIINTNAHEYGTFNGKISKAIRE